MVIGSYDPAAGVLRKGGYREEKHAEVRKKDRS
jgi:hypothetical protein